MKLRRRGAGRAQEHHGLAGRLGQAHSKKGSRTLIHMDEHVDRRMSLQGHRQRRGA